MSLIINPYRYGSSGGGSSKTYWRIYIQSVNGPIGNGTPSIAELEFRTVPGGANVATGGTASANSSFSGSYDAAKAFDGDSGTLWNASGPPAAGQWIQYQLPSGMNIVEIAMTARNDAAGYGVGQTPASFIVQSSTSGSSFSDEWTVSGLTWADGETKVFTKP